MERFLPFAKLVANNASDVDTWKAVLDLIAKFRETTPNRIIEPTFGGTPRTCTSSTYQGSEQTKSFLEPAIRQELYNCTYEHVDGFWEKYFEDKEWAEKSEQIYERMKKFGQLNNLPQPPREEAVWNWWSDTQEKFFQGSRGVYYTTASKKDLTGTDSERQLDLLMKRRDISVAGKHHWEDIRVVGEHKASYTYRAAKFFQLGRYIRDVFTTQPTRRFVHGFLLLGSSMELYIFDRSGAYGATPFNIYDEPERFVRVMSAYVFMSDKELGLDTFIERVDGKQFVTVTEDGQGKRRRLQLEARPIAVQAAIVCRGTCCYRTADGKRVVKFSWRSDKRLAEDKHLRRAHEKGVQGVARLCGQETITTVADLRDGLTFTKKRKFRAPSQGTPSTSQSSVNSSVRNLSISKRASDEGGGRPSKKSRSKSQQSKLSQEYTAGNDSQQSQNTPQDTQDTRDSQATQYTPVDASFRGEQEKFHNRVMSCLAISPAGRALSTFQSVPELLCAFRDAIKAHRSLFLDGKILHRDVSENNIIITDPKDNQGFSGTLIDMDLAVNVDDIGYNERSGAQRMTGTLKYMAIEIVELAFRDDRRDLEHTYRHDLESFFYVLLDICINYGWPSGRRRGPDPLQGWYIGRYKDMAGVKASDMSNRSFESTILNEFSPTFDGAKDLATVLRVALFGKGELDTGTPSKAAPYYDDIIKGFDEAIRKFQR